WKRKVIEPARLQRFTRFWKTKGGRISGASFFGITKLDLTLVDCWRKIQSGNLRLLFMISSLRPEAAEAKKQKRVSTIFASNIFFGAEQECGGAAGNTTASHKDRKENVLRCGVRLPYPAALRSARRDSDYR